MPINYDTEYPALQKSFYAANARIRELEQENALLRTAIQRALDDEESGEGWGPDITVCAYLRDALEPPKGEGK